MMCSETLKTQSVCRKKKKKKSTVTLLEWRTWTSLSKMKKKSARFQRHALKKSFVQNRFKKKKKKSRHCTITSTILEAARLVGIWSPPKRQNKKSLLDFTTYLHYVEAKKILSNLGLLLKKSLCKMNGTKKWVRSSDPLNSWSLEFLHQRSVSLQSLPPHSSSFSDVIFHLI